MNRISQLSGPCSRCGHVKHFNDKCPAIDRRCNVCSMLGHYGSCCKSKSSKPKNARVNQLVSDASFLGEVDSKSDSWTQLVVVEGLDLPVRFKLDSGADVSVVPSRLCAHVSETYLKAGFEIRPIRLSETCQNISGQVKCPYMVIRRISPFFIAT